MKHYEGPAIIDNIIRVSGKKNISEYSHSFLKRVLPGIYDKYGCIRIRFMRELEPDIKYLVRMCWHCGYTFEKNKLKGNTVRVRDGVLTTEMREIVLKKIGAILFHGNEEFERKWKDTQYEFEEEKTKIF